MSLPKQTKIAAGIVAAIFTATGAMLECMPADMKAPGTDIVQGCLHGQGMRDDGTQIIIRPVSCLVTPGALVGKAWKALSPS